MKASHPAVARVACTGCHMPKRSVSDGAHTVFTDHRIARKPAEVPAGQATGLRAWRQPGPLDLRQRSLGLALITVGERDQRPEWIQEGYKHLRAVFPRYERDADVLTAIGMVLFLKDQHQDAAKLLQAAIALRPGDAALHEKLAAVLRAAGDRAAAARALERAIAIDPLRETAYHMLHEMQPEAKALDRYLRVNPQSVLAREALRR
jgi:tetratricopeptide (TPR) repeat protein